MKIPIMYEQSIVVWSLGREVFNYTRQEVWV